MAVLLAHRTLKTHTGLCALPSHLNHAGPLASYFYGGFPHGILPRIPILLSRPVLLQTANLGHPPLNLCSFVAQLTLNISSTISPDSTCHCCCCCCFSTIPKYPYSLASSKDYFVCLDV